MITFVEKLLLSQILKEYLALFGVRTLKLLNKANFLIRKYWKTGKKFKRVHQILQLRSNCIVAKPAVID